MGDVFFGKVYTSVTRYNLDVLAKFLISQVVEKSNLTYCIRGGGGVTKPYSKNNSIG